MLHADRVIIRLPCSQGQLSRIWKVQCDWLSLGKKCCFPLSRRLWGGKKNELPLKRLRGRLGKYRLRSISLNSPVWWCLVGAADSVTMDTSFLISEHCCARTLSDSNNFVGTRAQAHLLQMSFMGVFARKGSNIVTVQVPLLCSFCWKMVPLNVTYLKE